MNQVIASEKALAYIQDMNLSYLVRRLIEKENWVEEDAKSAVRRYKNFLVLAVKYPDGRFPPALDMDEVWHAHILHTKEYMRDCEQIFGKYLHHKPASGEEDERMRMQEAGARAAQLYLQEFDEFYHGVLDVSSFW